MELKPSQFLKAFRYLLSKDKYEIYNFEGEIGLENNKGQVVLSKVTIGMESRYYAYNDVRKWINNHLTKYPI